MPPINYASKKLGKREPKFDPRTLLMASYLTDELPNPPARVKWSTRITDIGAMGNNDLGNCTCATAGHMIQSWTANSNAQVILSDKAIIDAYSAVTGYTPSDPNTDQGAYILDVLNYWRKVGIGGRKIHSFVSQEPKNRQHVQHAVNLFGGCYLGIWLPKSALTQRVWSVVGGPDAVPGSWGGHAVNVVDYNPTGPICITWGELKTMTWAFFEKYCVEAYAALSTDWADADKTPNGFDFAQLQADLGDIAK